ESSALTFATRPAEVGVAEKAWQSSPIPEIKDGPFLAATHPDPLFAAFASVDFGTDDHGCSECDRRRQSGNPGHAHPAAWDRCAGEPPALHPSISPALALRTA